MKEENPIDELFKRELQHKEIKPSEAVWAKIDAGINHTSSGRKGYYWMRAAVVTLLLGVSSWVYFSQNERDLMHIEPSRGKVSSQEQNTTKDKAGAVDEPKEKAAEGEKKENQAEPAKRKIEPIIRNSATRNYHFVETEPALVDEAQLAVEDEFEPESVSLQEKTPVKPVVKFKYTVPVTQKSFYAAKEEEKKEKPGIKDRVVAYANDQFTNLLNGEPVELPKTETKGKPQLEINLGKLFNN